MQKAQFQWNAAGVGPAGSRRRARRVGPDLGKRDQQRPGLFAPAGANEKTPASRTARVWYLELDRFFSGEAKPASALRKAWMEGRFVLLGVVMTRLACFDRECLLGRNLITLFRCVNTFAKIISGPSRGSRRRSDRAIASRASSDLLLLAHARKARCKNAAFNAFFLLQRDQADARGDATGDAPRAATDA